MRVFIATFEEMRAGDLARVATADGGEILLTATRNSIYTRDLFTRHGIDIASKRVLCIKSLRPA